MLERYIDPRAVQIAYQSCDPAPWMRLTPYIYINLQKAMIRIKVEIDDAIESIRMLIDIIHESIPQLIYLEYYFMRLAIITSTDIRHRHVARMLARSFNVVSVGYEAVAYQPVDVANDNAITPDHRDVVRQHFAERARQEILFLGHDAEFLTETKTMSVTHIPPGQLNSDQTFTSITSHNPDTIVIYGTNLIRDPLLHHFAGRMINMHLGLSPYYRGTATNFYPLLNDEPEYIGATIHLIDAGIDSGPIIGHARPTINPDDMPHTIGCKAIIAGIQRLTRALEDHERGKLDCVPQWAVEHPRLYLRKHYRPSDVVRLYDMIDDGVIPRYVARASEVSSRLRLID